MKASIIHLYFTTSDKHLLVIVDAHIKRQTFIRKVYPFQDSVQYFLFKVIFSLSSLRQTECESEYIGFFFVRLPWLSLAFRSRSSQTASQRQMSYCYCAQLVHDIKWVSSTFYTYLIPISFSVR